jgi:hypothetical protein
LEISPRAVVVARGACATLHIDFRPAAPLDRLHGRPTVFVHFLGPRSGPLSGLDHALPGAWAAGQPLSYDLRVCPSALDPPLPIGQHRLTLGLYDDSWGYRWPLETGNSEDVGRREYLLGSVTVGPGPAPPAEGTGN